MDQITSSNDSGQFFVTRDTESREILAMAISELIGESEFAFDRGEDVERDAQSMAQFPFSRLEHFTLEELNDGPHEFIGTRALEEGLDVAVFALEWRRHASNLKRSNSLSTTRRPIAASSTERVAWL